MVPNLPTTTGLKNNFLLKQLTVLAVLIFGFCQNVNAQVSSYTVAQTASTPAYAILPVGKTNLFATTGNTDDAIATPVVALPFTFQFNGSPYTTANVSTNGFMTFGATAPSATEYYPISSATGYNGAISAYGWDMDLVAASTTINVSTAVTGVSPNRIFKVEWIVRRSASPGALATDTSNMQFQVWLYETSNIIELQYGTFTASSTGIVIDGQVGLRGATNADFLNFDYSAAANWPASPAVMPFGTVNTATVRTRGTAPIQIAAGSNRTFRFTPVTCFAPTAINIPAVSITSTTATINWTIPASGTPGNYPYEIRTSGAPGSGPGGLAQSGTITPATLTSLNATGLLAGTTYTFYIRSDCGSGNFSSWTAGTTFTTLCNALNVPYYEPFDNGVGTNAVLPYHTNLPTCTSQQNVGTGNPWVTTNQDSYYTDAGMDFNILMYNGQSPGNSNPANVWFFSQGINLVGGTTYRMSYFYGGTSTPSTVQNKMKVAFFNAPLASSLVGNLDDHPNIKGSPFENIINFTPATTGVYYLGLNAYSAPNNGQLYVDDIQLVVSNCLKPTAVSVSAITYNSATLSWTAPTPAPAGGYAYYYSTSATAPTNSTVPSGFTAAGVNNVNITGLSGSTNYYFWVRSNCGFGEFGEWVALNNSGSPFFTTLVAPPAYCTPSSTSTASFINNFLTTGGIANISNPSGYTAGGYASYLAQVVSQSAGNTINFTVGISGPTVGVGIWVDWNNDGVFNNTLYNSGTNPTGELMYNTGAYITTLNASFAVPLGQAVGTYRLRVVLDYWATSPNPCTISATGPRGEAEDYTFNVLTPPPAIAINSATSTQCAGTNSPLITLTTPTSNFNTYSWSPSTGVSGSAAAGWVINSNTTQTYTLTGTQTVSPFSTNTTTFNYVANQPPTPITIATPLGTNVCPSGGTPVSMVASGGQVSGVAVANAFDNFNTGAVGWTSTNTSTGGNVAGPVWTIRPSGYNPAGSTGITSIVSNDNTSFFLSNSDSQGSGSTTNVELISPVFSLAGYTTANLSFYHFVRFFLASNNPYAKVLISTDGGVTYPTTLQQWLGTTALTHPALATPTAFGQTNINLTPYVGQTNLRIKFSYYDKWGYIWAIDNFEVTGSAATNIVWNTQTTPVANGLAVPGLYTSYTSATVNTPYIAGTLPGVTTVYALPSSATTYTASASTTSPVCTSTASQAITTTAVSAGTASSDQTICFGSPSDLTLTGYSGAITGWQSANNAAFTVSVINIPSSASATLTSAQMGVLTSDKYYRAVVTNGGCTSYSTIVHITFSSTLWDGSVWDNGTPTATKAAIFDDVYSSTGDLNACSVLITNGDVVFNSNHNLIVQNTVNTSGGTLTFNNNASLVQQVAVTNAAGIYNGGNVGNITYNRTTPSPGVRLFDYTYWSSPVNPQTLVALSPATLFDKYFFYNTTINNWQSIASSNLMVPGTGYIIRAPQTYNPTTPALFTGSFYGVPNNGTISTNITVGAGTINLIGNPYPSAIDIDYFLTDSFNDPKIAGTIYLWTHNTPITGNNYAFADYATYNLTGGVGTGSGTASVGTNNSIPSGKVAAGQSFMIEGSIPASTNSVVFRNSMRVVGNNNQFYRSSSIDENPSPFASIERNRVWLELFNSEGAYKQTLVGYIQNATNDYDDTFDGRLVDVGNTVSLYSTVQTEKLAIQGRALPFDTNDIVPLGYRSNVAGNFTIKLSDFDGFFTNTTIYIEDLLLNVIHDLKQSDYNFTTNSGTFDNRFQLRYTNGTLNTNDVIFNDNTVVVYKNTANEIVINSSNTLMKEIKVFDIRGRQLFVKDAVNANEFKITNLNSSDQVLIISITSQDGLVVNKKIIF